jgi:DNA-binding MarR family transcriptional regulator/N-acetylglutamate synthase-like GNAT family acetyltransferase
MAMTLDDRISAVRAFNRFYTRRVGLLGADYLGSTFTVTEARVLYELANRDGPTATDIGRDLGLDAGYLSRILAGFTRRGLLHREPAADDRRRRHLALTDAGRSAFAPLDSRSHDEIGYILGELRSTAQDRLVDAMRTIEQVLEPQRQTAAPYLIRQPRAGDMGWVVHRHGVIYADEYGWDARFEGLVAGIVARFVERLDPARERCWIAERDGATVGCVFLVRRSKTIGQLRLLLVEPEARGLGIGARLVDECVRFARQAGYRRVMLWTNDVLVAARRIYEATGFQLVEEEAHHSFGHDLVGQIWELRLNRQ